MPEPDIKKLQQAQDIVFDVIAHVLEEDTVEDIRTVVVERLLNTIDEAERETYRESIVQIADQAIKQRGFRVE